MPDAFYEADGERLVPSELTRGPWDPGAQHAGPPSALVARAIERFEARAGLRVGRITLEILRPVPLAPLSVAARVVRPGRSVELRDFFPTGEKLGYHTAMEYRFVAGGFLEPGPATVWMRPRVPLVAGEEITPLQRVFVAADSGNGVSAALDWRRFIFINTDLTVHLLREPAGEWVCLDAVTHVDGIGLTDTALFDERGRIGRAAQTLLVRPR